MALAAKINWLTVAYSVALTGLLVVSCKSANLTAPDPVKPISAAIDTTKVVKKGMGTAADNIDQRVVEVRKVTPEKLVPKIGPHLDGINVETDHLRVLQGNLDSVSADLSRARADVEKLKGINGGQADEIAKLKKEKESALHHLMVWVILLSAVGVGIAASLVSTGRMWGISLGFGCLVTLGLAVFITQYSMWFAIGAASLCVLGLGYVVWQLFTTKKISTELVQTVEAAKQGMSPSSRNFLFGNGAIGGNVDATIQSPLTKQFVSKLRAKKKVKLAPATTAVPLGHEHLKV